MALEQQAWLQRTFTNSLRAGAARTVFRLAGLRHPGVPHVRLHNGELPESIWCSPGTVQVPGFSPQEPRYFNQIEKRIDE